MPGTQLRTISTGYLPGTEYWELRTRAFHRSLRELLLVCPLAVPTQGPALERVQPERRENQAMAESASLVIDGRSGDDAPARALRADRLS